jgi:mxaJ protein
MKRLAWLLTGLFAAAGWAQPAAAPPALRVCADPDNLPYSHADGSGMENRIAELVAADLGLPLQYAWLPDRRGFVRKTMGAGLCDLIVGVPVDFERTLNTRPYYRSSYVLVERAGRQPPVRDFHDPRLRQWRIGVQLVGDDMAATPPGHALVQVGALHNVIGFPVPGDEPAAARMVHAIERGELDAAFIWGPQAGYFAQRAAVPLQLRLLPAPGQAQPQRFTFAIAMGVRRGDTVLRERLDELLQRRRGDIERILAGYGVPLLEDGAP